MSGRHYRLSGDEGVGLFEPTEIRSPTFQRLDPQMVTRLRDVKGLTATASDILDEMGWNLAAPATVLVPRFLIAPAVVGHAITIRYLPERMSSGAAQAAPGPPKLAHHVVYRLAQPGDVMVVEAHSLRAVSVLGGRAAAAAHRIGMSGVVVDGAIRDLDEVAMVGLPIWSTWATPITGKSRAEAVGINTPIACAGVQVQPGDLVLADTSGVCFLPNEIASEVADRILQVAADEAGDLA